MPRTAEVPGISRLDLPEARHAIPQLHAYLRECILDGTLVAGTKLSQVTLSEQLGVSRTPLREVLRMLQEEGLVEIEPNQRTRVTGLDPLELDEIYGRRILLESLGLSLTLDRFGPKERKLARTKLSEMNRAAKRNDLEGWFSVHADFHRTLTSGADAPLQKQLALLGDRTIRYIRMYQVGEPRGWQAAGAAEHQQIFDALVEQDASGAISGLAHHLARTARRVLTGWAPDFEPRAVPRALSLIDEAHGVPRPATQGAAAS